MSILKFIKKKITMLKEFLPEILAFIGGGGLMTVFTAKAVRKKSNAEATGAEIGNASLVNNEWQELNEERKSELAELKQALKDKEKYISERWNDISQYRDDVDNLKDEIIQLKEDIGKLKTENEGLKLTHCTVHGCSKRQPPSNY